MVRHICNPGMGGQEDQELEASLTYIYSKLKARIHGKTLFPKLTFFMLP